MILELLDGLLTSLVYILTSFLLFYAGKWVHDLIHTEFSLPEELFVKDNPAMALSVVGYYAGLTLAIGGALVGPSHGLWRDLWDILVYGVLGVVLLNISWYACDFFILRGFRASEEILRDRNQGAGAVAGAAMTASGFILFGSLQGEGGGMFSTIIFWALGQALLVLASWVYEWITPYSVSREMERDNAAVGVAAAGALIGMGMVIGLAAEEDFVSWGESLPHYLAYAIIGLGMLPAVRWLADKVLVPGHCLSHELTGQETPNMGAAYTEAFAYIAAAAFISWCS